MNANANESAAIRLAIAMRRLALALSHLGRSQSPAEKRLALILAREQQRREQGKRS